MKVLITDANVLIDLLKTQTVDDFFNLKYDIYTTYAVLNECYDEQQKILMRHVSSGRLSIFHLQIEDDSNIEALISAHKQLSYADCTILHTAKSMNAILLTGDRNLKLVSQSAKIEVRGIFWVFDEMLKYNILNKRKYIQKLSQLKDVNKWLPEDEFKKRII